MRETARARPSARSTSAGVRLLGRRLLFLPSPRRSRERLMRRRRSRVVGVHLHRRQRLERRRRLHRPELVDGRRDHPHQQDVPFVSENPQRRAEPIVATSRRSQAHVDEPVRGGGDVDGTPLALHGHRVAIVFRVVAVVVLEGDDLPRVLVRAADEREEGLGSSRGLMMSSLKTRSGSQVERGAWGASEPAGARARARPPGGCVVATPALAGPYPIHARHTSVLGDAHGRGREEPWPRTTRARRSLYPSWTWSRWSASPARDTAPARASTTPAMARASSLSAPSQHGPDARGEQWRLPGNPP